MSRNYLPECWKDDKRMAALFAPFRSREVNPQDWESKLEFWRSAINQWCLATKRVCFTENTVKMAFERNSQVPQGLQTVLNELLRSKLAQRTTDLGSLHDSNSWMSWGMNVLVKRPLSWSFSTLMNSVGKKEEDPDMEYVLVDVLKEKAEEVFERHRKHVEFESTDRVLETNTLWEQCQDLFESEHDFEVALIFLRKEKMLSSYGDAQMNVVKLRQKNEKVATPISEVDIGILRLKKAKDYLQGRITKLQDDADRLVEEARHHLKQNARASAKAALRKKKTIEKVITKRETSLQNLDELLGQIQDVESEKMVIDAYRTGVSGFHKTLKDGGITLDNVDDTMAAIQEVFDMNEDIQDTISQPIGSQTTEMSELESELADLLSAPEEPPPPPLEPPVARRKVKEGDDLPATKLNVSISDIRLPNVPTFNPAAPSALTKLQAADH